MAGALLSFIFPAIELGMPLTTAYFLDMLLDGSLGFLAGNAFPAACANGFSISQLVI